MCLRRELEILNTSFLAWHKKIQMSFRKLKLTSDFFWSVRTETHFRIVFSFCFNSYFSNRVKYLYDELHLISSSQEIKTLSGQMQHVHYPTFLNLFLTILWFLMYCTVSGRLWEEAERLTLMQNLVSSNLRHCFCDLWPTEKRSAIKYFMALHPHSCI